MSEAVSVGVTQSGSSRRFWVTHRCICLGLDTDLVSFANRRRCENVVEHVHLLSIVAAPFIGNGIFCAVPKGDGNTFAGLAIGTSELSVSALAGRTE